MDTAQSARRHCCLFWSPHPTPRCRSLPLLPRADASAQPDGLRRSRAGVHPLNSDDGERAQAFVTAVVGSTSRARQPQERQ